MDFVKLKEILEIVAGVGIEELVIEPIDPQRTRLRGANKERNIIIYDEVDDAVSDLPMGLMSVRALLSRLDLFDPDKAKIETTDDKKLINNVTIKQGRKKASYKCADPTHLAVPKKIPGNLDSDNKIELEKDFVDYISQVITSMSYTGAKAERTISLSVTDEKMKISIFDGEDDTFTDERSCEGSGVSDFSKSSWEVHPFLKVLKKSVEQDNDALAKFSVTEHGIAVFSVGDYSIIVAPVA